MILRVLFLSTHLTGHEPNLPLLCFNDEAACKPGIKYNLKKKHSNIEECKNDQQINFNPQNIEARSSCLFRSLWWIWSTEGQVYVPPFILLLFNQRKESESLWCLFHWKGANWASFLLSKLLEKRRRKWAKVSKHWFLTLSKWMCTLVQYERFKKYGLKIWFGVKMTQLFSVYQVILEVHGPSV